MSNHLQSKPIFILYFKLIYMILFQFILKIGATGLPLCQSCFEHIS